MTKCHYTCIKGVNINGHVAVSCFNIQGERETESGGRERSSIV